MNENHVEIVEANFLELPLDACVETTRSIEVGAPDFGGDEQLGPGDLSRGHGLVDDLAKDGDVLQNGKMYYSSAQKYASQKVQLSYS